MSGKNVFIGADHGGYQLKEAIIGHLRSAGCVVTDLGTHSNASCDYPLYAQAVCREVSTQNAFGILVCGSGIGMSMTANKFPGIRAALCGNEYLARMSRMHNDANVLCLGERVLGTGLALAIVDAFFGAEFEGGRHQRRIDQMEPAGNPS